MYPQTAWSSNVNLRERRLLNGGFYQTLRMTLLTCRFIGLLPISGLLNQSSKLARFSWKSFYSVIYIPELVIKCLLFCYITIELIDKGLAIPRILVCQFVGTFFFSSVALLRLCMKWRNMMTEIEAIEKKLPPMEKPRRAVIVANSTMFAILFICALSYGLYLVFSFKLTLLCYLRPDDSDLYIKSFLYMNYAWFYNHIPFSYYSGFILQILQAQGAFISNFITSIAAITSMYLTIRFQAFNRTFFQRQHKSRHSNPSWMDLQIYHARLTHLAYVVNDHMHPFIFITFWNNLFYISSQTYYTLNKLTMKTFQYSECFEIHSLEKEAVAFSAFMFLFALFKLFLVWFLAAELHRTSRKPLNALYTVPSKAYTVEMQRLLTQIYRSKVSLTGLNLFNVTRGTMLTMLATVLTYELVLLQI